MDNFAHPAGHARHLTVFLELLLVSRTPADCESRYRPPNVTDSGT
ncbi:hypothetical protein HMPREF9343_01082 [Cutibacterium acnes HL099PA1]|nr:hypothetical protein HMPREF9343_01082 [Cutibacterium acnes HL099PA1]